MKTAIDTILRRMHPPEGWVEIHDSGFTAFSKRGAFAAAERPVAWSDVTHIYARMIDCYSSHVLALVFMCGPDQHVYVDDIFEGWRELVDAVNKHFPDFDQYKFKEVEGAFPGEHCLLCWGQEDEITNMCVDPYN